MSQNDLSIANQGFASFRSDLNSALQALGSTNSGTSAPSTTYANQLFYDTTNNILKIRNEDNDAFISLFTLDQANDNIESLTVNGVLTADSLVANGGVTIDNISIDGTEIDLSSGDLTLDVAGDIVLDAGGADIILKDGGSTFGTLTNSGGTFVVNANTNINTKAGIHTFDNTDGSSEYMRINSSGVGIGTTSPDTKLHIDQTSQGNFTEAMRISNTGGGSDEGNYIQFEVANTSGHGARFGGRREGTGGVGLHFFTGAINANPTEAMRIDSSGNLMGGGMTSADLTSQGFRLGDTGFLYVSAGNDSNTAIFNRRNSHGEVLRINKDGSPVGQINSKDGELAIGTINTGFRFVDGSNAISPHSLQSNSGRDNAIALGSSGARFDDAFITNGVTTGSDQNEKQDIASATTKELNVASKLSALFKTYKWKDAVEQKGDKARTHTGIIAQEVQSAFSAEGLDASNYGMFMSDTWWEKEIKVDAVEADEEKGIEAKDAYTYMDTKNEKTDGYTEKTRLGVRYPELFSFIFSSIEARLTALESK